MKQFSMKILLIVLLIACCSCSAKYDVITPDMQQQFNNAFKSGKVDLDCEIKCNWSWLTSFNELMDLHDNSQWSKLAQKVMQIGRKIDMAYYFLGRSAEGLGYYEAALTFYKQSLILYNDKQSIHHCRSTDTCGGMYLSSAVDERMTIVQNILTPSKVITDKRESEPKIPEKKKIQNNPLSKEETLELKMILHAKNACEMCSWPMPEKTKQEILKYTEYYKVRTGGLNDPLLINMNAPLYEMTDAFAKGTINRPGLVMFCTDPNERKRYDEILKSIKPFNKVNTGYISERDSKSASYVKSSDNAKTRPYKKVDLSHLIKWVEQKKNIFEEIDGVRLIDDKNFKKAFKSTIGSKFYDLFYSKDVQNCRYYAGSEIKKNDNILTFSSFLLNWRGKEFYAVFYIHLSEGYIDIIWGKDALVDSLMNYKIYFHDGRINDVDINKYINDGHINFDAVYNDFR